MANFPPKVFFVRPGRQGTTHDVQTVGEPTLSPVGLLSVAGANLGRMGVVALEAVLAVVAGAAVRAYRGRVKGLMGSVN